MSTIINATTTNGVVIQPDNSGSLVLQTNSGTTALTIDTSQNVAFAKGFTVGATAAPAFSVYQNSSQTISSSTFTKVQLQIEEFDTNSNFNNTGSTVGSAPSYSFLPTIAGYYQFNFSLDGTVAGLPMLYKNGSRFKDGGVNAGNAVGTANTGSALAYANGTTDYFEFYFYQVSGSNSTTTGSSFATYFQAAMVRSA